MAKRVAAIAFYDLGAALGRAVGVLELACRVPAIYPSDHDHANLTRWRQRGHSALQGTGNVLEEFDSDMVERRTAARELSKLQEIWDEFSASTEHMELIENLRTPTEDRGEDPPRDDPLNAVPYFRILYRLRDFARNIADRFGPRAGDAFRAAFALHRFREYLPYYTDDGDQDGDGTVPASGLIPVDLEALVTEILRPEFNGVQEPRLRVLPEQLGRNAYEGWLGTPELSNYQRQRSTYHDWLEETINRADAQARHFLDRKKCELRAEETEARDPDDCTVWEMRPLLPQEKDERFVGQLEMNKPGAVRKPIGWLQLFFLHEFSRGKKEKEIDGKLWREVSVKTLVKKMRDWRKKEYSHLTEADEGDKKLRVAICKSWSRFKNQMKEKVGGDFFTQERREEDRVFRMDVSRIELRKPKDSLPKFF